MIPSKTATTGKRHAPDQTRSQDVRAALERVAASSALAKSPQLAHFLTFIVEETLAGRAERLKAYTIATDGLGRDDDFDPQADPIVRVEAGRLRRALGRYYGSDGRNDPLVIELPRGSYVPTFRARIELQGVIARINGRRRQLAGALRENSRLVILVAAVAAAVSMTFDLTWMALGKLRDQVETIEQAPPTVPSTDTARRTR